ncbi:MAG TPA: TonB family protein [Geothrix sp.]
MTILALRRGRGPAFPDLPPTLQPQAVLASAPPSDTLRAVSLSGLAYLLLAGGAVSIASFAPQAVPPSILQPTPPWRPVELEGPPRSRPIERAAPVAAGSGGGSLVATNAAAPTRADPEAPASGLPTVDRSHDLPGAGPALPSAAGPASGPAGSSTGPVIHDFSMTGLTPRHRVDPLYPDFARRARIQGTVVLMMIVNERGVPMQVRALDGHPALQEAALQAARQWRFEPARLDGLPVAASFRLTLNFRLRVPN